ncbi:MAG: hypothetical protein ACRENI_00970 [Gemmatimonadaceae bacterium]
MLKYVLVLVAGIVIGYFYGFSDARTHEHNVIERTVERVGGSNRDKYRNDIDARMESAGR